MSMSGALIAAIGGHGLMHLLSLADWPRERIEAVLDLGRRMKRAPADHARRLSGRVLLMVFQRPSLRTRLSFEVAMLQLGGHAIRLDVADTPWGAGKESPADTARSASRYVDGILARTANAVDLAEIAAASGVPVINGLTETEHPCQALGDLLTILETFGRLEGIRLAYVGDARNNVTHSLLDGCARTGVSMIIGCPEDPDYMPDAAILARAREAARTSGSEIRIEHRVLEAATKADVVYTDTWMSYHIPREARDRREAALRPFRVTSEVMRAAKPEAVFMHCLPALRGQEQSAEVLDGPRSIVFEQAENRLHSGKAILATLLE